MIHEQIALAFGHIHTFFIHYVFDTGPQFLKRLQPNITFKVRSASTYVWFRLQMVNLRNTDPKVSFATDLKK